MPKDDAIYYYADGEQAIGPFSLSKLKLMAKGGIISADVYVAVAESDDWKPLNELLVGKSTSPAKSPALKRKTTSGRFDCVLSLWREHVLRWPHAAIAGVMILLLSFWLYGWIDEHLYPGGFDWHLYLANAFMKVLVLALLLLGIKALKDTRKLAPLTSGLKKFGVSLLLVLLFLTALPSAFFVVDLYMVFSAHNHKQTYVSVAPEQFRTSIIENRAVPVLGEDALVIRDLNTWLLYNTGSIEGFVQKQLKRNISPPVSELLVLIVFAEHHPEVDMTEDLGAKLQALANLYGFHSWQELNSFMFSQQAEW